MASIGRDYGRTPRPELRGSRGPSDDRQQHELGRDFGRDPIGERRAREDGDARAEPSRSFYDHDHDRVREGGAGPWGGGADDDPVQVRFTT